MVAGLVLDPLAADLRPINRIKKPLALQAALVQQDVCPFPQRSLHDPLST